MNAAKFYWAVVGNASPEPVAVVDEEGRRVAYTCGCPDPFVVDGADARIQLIPCVTNKFAPEASYLAEPEPMQLAVTHAQHKQAREDRERMLEADRKRGIRHGHRRFNP